MTVTATARRIYRATKCTPAAVAAIRARHTELAVELATDHEAGFELTSTAVNGQMFSGQRTITKSESLAILSQVVWMYDNGQPMPRTTRLKF